jgi:hypothetical protein
VTTESLWRLCCDAPDCTASTLVEQIADRPDGWTRIRSTAHFDNQPPIAYGRGRSRRAISVSDQSAGGFTLHLCPRHPDTFVEHRPTTQGSPMARGEFRRRVQVGCSCGFSKPLGAWDGMVVGQRPVLVSEFFWWQHLPAELQAYALRDRAAA